MKKGTFIILLFTHLAIGSVGFGAGIYTLPLLLAPPAPLQTTMNQLSKEALYKGIFTKDLQDSDFLHWGDGKVYIGKNTISLDGKLAPGPDYQLYLSTKFIDTEADFMQSKNTMIKVGEIKTFKNFVVEVPEYIDVSKYNSVIVWCEAFGQFITAAKYK